MRFPYRLKHAELNLNLTPLIDVVFLLIIFFLVTSSFVNIAGVRVELPQMLTSKETAANQLAVEIDKTGSYYFGEGKVSFDQLRTKLKEVKKTQKLTIMADKQTAFDHVMQVWDLAREAGLKEVTVVTSKKVS